MSYTNANAAFKMLELKPDAMPREQPCKFNRTIRPFHDRCTYFGMWVMNNCACIQTHPVPLIRTNRMSSPVSASLTMQIPPGRYELITTGDRTARHATCTVYVEAQYVHIMQRREQEAEVADAPSHGGPEGSTVVVSSDKVDAQRKYEQWTRKCTASGIGVVAHHFILLHESKLKLTLYFNPEVDIRQPSIEAIHLRGSHEWCSALTGLCEQICGVVVPPTMVMNTEVDYKYFIESVQLCMDWLDNVESQLQKLEHRIVQPTWGMIDDVAQFEYTNYVARIDELLRDGIPPAFVTSSYKLFYTHGSLRIPLIRDKLQQELHTICRTSMHDLATDGERRRIVNTIQYAIQYMINVRTRLNMFKQALLAAFKSTT